MLSAPVPAQQQQGHPSLRLTITVRPRDLREGLTAMARRRQGSMGGSAQTPMVGPICMPISTCRQRPDRLATAVDPFCVRAVVVANTQIPYAQ
jgi:hypothetical protein